MKKPVAFYFVAAWATLVLLLELERLELPKSTFLDGGEFGVPVRRILGLFYIAIFLWQTVGLFQLKRFNRRLASLLLGLWVVEAAWRAANLLRDPEGLQNRVLITISTFILCNCVCVWYLTRREFRGFATRYVAAKEESNQAKRMQQASQDRILRDLRHQRAVVKNQSVES